MLQRVPAGQPSPSSGHSTRQRPSAQRAPAPQVAEVTQGLPCAPTLASPASRAPASIGPAPASAIAASVTPPSRGASATQTPSAHAPPKHPRASLQGLRHRSSRHTSGLAHASPQGSSAGMQPRKPALCSTQRPPSGQSRCSTHSSRQRPATHARGATQSLVRSQLTPTLGPASHAGRRAKTHHATKAAPRVCIGANDDRAAGGGPYGGHSPGRGHSLGHGHGLGFGELIKSRSGHAPRGAHLTYTPRNG